MSPADNRSYAREGFPAVIPPDTWDIWMDPRYCAFCREESVGWTPIEPPVNGIAEMPLCEDHLALVFDRRSYDGRDKQAEAVERRKFPRGYSES